MNREEQLARERKLARVVAVAAIAGVSALVGSIFLAPAGDDSAELLRAIDEDNGGAIAAGVLSALGFCLLAPMVVYLFRAASFRSEDVRRPLIGLLIATPIFLAAASILGAFANIDAADEFIKSGLTGDSEEVTDKATDIRNEASLRPLTTGFGLAGALGFAFGLAYTCLHAMRTGLLTRFIGSLGMALAVVTFVIPALLTVMLLWFIFVSLVVVGIAPGGRPPAWDAGRAIPWPTPGERMAENMDPRSREDSATPENGDEPAAGAPRQRGERRKRKRRT